MKKTTVLFDLDGTLLPMDQEQFVKAYFGGLCAVMVPKGYRPDDVIKAIWSGTEAMVRNDGSSKNEARFWQKFNELLGECDNETFDYYYQNEFDKVSASCGFTPRAKEIIELVKSRGLTPVLATNPIFPPVATHCRIRWAGLDESDFAFVSNYENSTFCKPNPAYYQEILDRLGLCADECVMVGNDATEDLAAKKLGIDVFILTDCLINKHGENLCAIPHGSFDELEKFICEL
ncbi:MAG: HAD family hydrolase [Ruminococcaceae bacterium]|nr:HAD family hydrolase [Oscillospiraceae bacterium]